MNEQTPHICPEKETAPYVINIGRQLGSGGRAIGMLLAKELDIAYYDKEILTIAAQESGFCTEVFERSDEHKGFFRSMFGNLIPAMSSGTDFYRNQLSDEHLFQLQAEAIRKAAQKQSCIFIGRCADYILRDHPRCVNVFVVADKEDRIRRICEADSCDRSAAEKKIENGDRQRAEYYNFYSTGRWGAADTYHLCINSSTMGIEATAEFIKNFIRKKLGL